MRRLKLSLLFIITAIFTIQIVFANENFYMQNTPKKGNDIELEIAKIDSGTLKNEVINRLGNREINNVTSITINDGFINNNDFKFLSEEVINLKSIKLGLVIFDDKQLLVTFSDNKKLENVQLPNSKSGYKLSERFFANNTNLKNVELNGVNSLGKFTFENTKSLRSIDLSMVDSFEEGLFINSGIENVIFKNGYDLPKNFFKDTKSLTNIDISKAKTIGEGVFTNSAIEFVKLPTSYALEGYTFSNTKNLKKIDLSGATRLGVGDFYQSSIEEVIFPKNYNLPEFYFAKTTNLKNIDLKNSTEINNGAFAFSSIDTVELPKAFTMSEGLFQYAESLDFIDASGVEVFKDAVFAGSSLSKIIMPESFEVSNAMFAFMPNLESIDLSGAQFLGSNIFVKKGNNYDYFRKLFDGEDLVSNITNGIQSVIFGGSTVPSVSVNTFANLGERPPLVLLPKASEWDGFSNLITNKNNEIKNQLRFDAYTYNDLMISKDTLIKIGFENPFGLNADKENINAKYQWYFNGNEIINANQSTFTIDNFSINNEGLYRLEVTVDNQVYKLNDISLEANELAIDEGTLFKGYFLNEVVDEDVVKVVYVKDNLRESIDNDDLQFVYDFREVGNTSINITYSKDDLFVVADYQVKVADALPDKIKIKKGHSFKYNPKIDGFQFVLTAKQNEFFEVVESEESTEIEIIAKELYQGELDFKFNDRVGQIEIEIVRNLFWLWTSLIIGLILVLTTIIYLRLTRGMFKIKRNN